MTAVIGDIIHYFGVKYHNLIGCFFRIRNNKVFFDSFPDYSDNSRAMSDFLLARSDYDIYWAVNKLPSFRTDPQIHFVLKSEKWKYIYHTLTSKYLFSTHGAFSWANPQKQYFLCFWHGTMLKRIAFMQDPLRYKYYNSNVRFFSSPSETYSHLFAKSFNRSIETILLTGYPRIDFLLNGNDSLVKLGIDNTMYEKIVMYLPTFRQPSGGEYTDSTKNVFEDDFLNFADASSLGRWNSYFKEKGILLIVKPHPSDKNQLVENIMSNIVVIPHSKLLENDIQLYNVLHYADALITDFSSVFCDYMILDRPIGFMLSDIEEYSNGRGFVFEDPINKLPGYRIYDEKGFVAFCNEISKGEDSTKQLRHSLQPLYNTYTQGCFCERIANIINMEIRE